MAARAQQVLDVEAEIAGPSPLPLDRVGLVADEDPEHLPGSEHGVGDAVDRRDEVGMLALPDDTERLTEIGGPHEDDVDARYRADLVQCVEAGRSLDLTDDQRLLVRRATFSAIDPTMP